MHYMLIKVNAMLNFLSNCIYGLKLQSARLNRSYYMEKAMTLAVTRYTIECSQQASFSYISYRSIFAIII